MDNPIDIDFLKHEPEGECFDVKSAKIKPADLAEVLIAFANTKGGVVAIGVSDKKRDIEGVSCVGEQHVKDLLAAKWDCCRPSPDVTEEFLDVVNAKGMRDRVLLLRVAPRREVVTRSLNETVFVRRATAPRNCAVQHCATSSTVGTNAVLRVSRTTAPRCRIWM